MRKEGVETAMRIAAITPDESPNAKYRLYMPMMELSRRGHHVEISLMPELRNPRSLLEFDVVFAWRLHGDAFCRSAQMVADAGIALVWDNDDDVQSLDMRGRAAQRYFGGFHGHRVFTLMVMLMRLANVVTTPSQHIAERYRQLSDVNVRVVENYVHAIQEIPRPRRPSRAERVVIGWVAGSEHQADIERLCLRETMQRLLDEFPNVEILNIGAGLGLKGERFHHIRNLPFEDLREHVSQMDIGIAPIVDIPFNRARSSIKVKEYAALSVPWLASPIGPYKDLGEKHGGRLVPDDGWYEALRALVLDGRARRRLSRRASAWAAGETIEANGHLWEAVFAEACGERVAVRA
jgi:glycosyltransferase involved in cell wall biosynthesis